MAATRAIVAGLGKTGVSVVRYLLRQGWQVNVTDTRAEPPGRDELRSIAPDLPVSLGALDASLLNGADCVVAASQENADKDPSKNRDLLERNTHTAFPANDARQWRAAPDDQMRTDA